MAPPQGIPCAQHIFILSGDRLSPTISLQWCGLLCCLWRVGLEFSGHSSTSPRALASRPHSHDHGHWHLSNRGSRLCIFFLLTLFGWLLSFPTSLTPHLLLSPQSPLFSSPIYLFLPPYLSFSISFLHPTSPSIKCPQVHFFIANSDSLTLISCVEIL